MLRHRAGARFLGWLDFSPWAISSVWPHRHRHEIVNLQTRPFYMGNEWPHCDFIMSEDKSEYLIRADVPGVNAKDLKVKVDKHGAGDLRIEGKWDMEKREHSDQDDWTFFERKKGSFMRRFPLPKNADAEGLTASMYRNVLTLRIPVKPQQTEVELESEESRFREIEVEVEPEQE